MIIGRKKEKELLERALREKKNQFVTVYGRRRVGKTYLIDEFFKNKKCRYFHVMGLPNGKLKEQLENFTKELSITFLNGLPIKTPASWKEAFEILTSQIKKSEGKVVLFFDELPWMVTRKSGLLDVIGYFWNKEWLRMHNIIFVACGSSASWMLKNILYDKGSLHNRTNIEIPLLPFNLLETKEYLQYRGIRLNDKHVLSLYMAIGGIPYYLGYVSPNLTAQQNIQRLFFDKNAPLRGEYSKLFKSLFNHPDAYIELIELIARKREGVSLMELGKVATYSRVGGRLSIKLQHLCDAGFIEKFDLWGKERGAYYKAIDEFCLFYLYWVKNAKTNKFMPDHWVNESRSPRYHVWAGYAFEAVCHKHTIEIFRALNINHSRIITSWRYTPKTDSERGAQIDLIFVRDDDAITLCEIKYTDKPFVIDKRYAAVLTNKINQFRKQTKTDKQLFLAMITANGLKPTMYSEEMVSEVVVLKDLFKSIG